jgi:Cu/Ag efflux pump CusA
MPRLFPAALTALLCLSCGRTGQTSPGELPVAAAPRAIAPIEIDVASDANDTAAGMERAATIPLELALAGLPGARELSSRSVAGAARIQVALAPGTDVFAARQDVARRIETADLPAGVVAALGPAATPGADDERFVVTGADADLLKARDLVDWAVRPWLLRLPGVADVTACGGRVREVHVELDAARLASSGLPVGAVAAAITRGGAAPGGQATGSFVVRGLGDYRELEELAHLVVGSARGNPVRLTDVAQVRFGGEPAQCIALLDDVEVAAGRVRVRADAPTGLVARTLADMQQALPAGAKVTPLRRDPGARVLHFGLRVPATVGLDARVRLAHELSATLRAHGAAHVLAEVVAPESIEAQDLALHVSLPPAAGSQAVAELEDALRRGLAGAPGVGREVDGTVGIALIGPDLQSLAETAAHARDLLAAVPGCGSIAIDGAEVAPRLQVSVDRGAVARNGVDLGDLGLTLAAARAGAPVAYFADGVQRSRVRLRFSDGADRDPSWLGSLPVAGAAVPLSALARFEVAGTPTVILRVDGQRRVELRVEVVGRRREAFVREAKRQLATALALPVGYLLTWSEGAAP